MNNFVKGVLFAGGTYVFGKTMYRLGALDANRKNLVLWKKLKEETDEMVKKFKKEEESKEA